MTGTVTVHFCGERYPVAERVPFVIGRDADLSIDDNPYLHRQFLRIDQAAVGWTLSNIGDRLAATVVDPETRLEAHLTPGASLPLVFAHVRVTFSAGPTTYEVDIRNHQPPLRSLPTRPDSATEAGTTLGGAVLNDDQRLLLLALAEPRLRADGAGPWALPSTREAAARLGWTVTKFNRKLDHLCQKFARTGVRGLHGGPDQLASQRRSRLVEHAVASGLVTGHDLQLLDG